MTGAMPRARICVPRPRPSAVMPGRLISSGYFQRASYSRNPVGLIIASRRKAQLLGVTSGSGLVIREMLVIWFEKLGPGLDRLRPCRNSGMGADRPFRRISSDRPGARHDETCSRRIDAVSDTIR